MAFTKRSLTNSERAKIRASSLAVEEKHFPPEQWDWAVDEERDLYFTQLISSTHEMREGVYRYLLLQYGQSAIIWVDAWNGREIKGHVYLNAEVQREASAMKLGDKYIERVSSEAMEVVSYNKERLLFGGESA